MDSNANVKNVLDTKKKSNFTENLNTPTTILSKPQQTQKETKENSSQSETKNKSKSQTPMATAEMMLMTKIWEQLIEKQKLPKLPTSKTYKNTVKETNYSPYLPLKSIAPSDFPQKPLTILPLEPKFLPNAKKILPIEPCFLQSSEKVLLFEPIAAKETERVLLEEPTLCETNISITNQQLRIKNINELNSSLISDPVKLELNYPSLTGGNNIFVTSDENDFLQTVLNDTPESNSIDLFKAETEEFLSLDKEINTSKLIQKSSKYFQQCGVIQLSILDHSYCLTCFHCPAKYELWDWKNFVEHIEEKHKSLMPYQNNANSEKYNEAKQFHSSETLKQPEARNLYSLDEINNDSQIRIQSEDKLSKAASLFFEKNNLNFAHLNAKLEHKVFKITTPVSLQINTFKNEEIHVDTVLSSNKDKETSAQRNDVLNFRTESSERIFTFLKVFRLHPLLWHTRQHGRAVWDREAQTFIRAFNPSMSIIDLSSSLENARNLYFRFKTGHSELQNNVNLQKIGKMLSEIVELSKSYMFICKRCRTYFLDKDNFLTHQSLKHSIGNLTSASKCKLQAATKQAKRIVHEKSLCEELISCNYCKLSFANEEAFKKHVKEQHSDSVGNLLPYKFTKLGCNEKCRSNHLHLWRVFKHDLPRCKAKLCYTYFPLNGLSANHLNQKMVCEECGKCFFRNETLKKHRWRMHNASKFHCQACNFHFSADKNLIAHKERFHSNGTYVDRMKKLRRINIRRRLLQLNPNRRLKKLEWKCKKCGQLFERLGQLIRHKQDFGHHLEQQHYKCSHCDRTLSSDITFQRHLRDIHKILANSSDIKHFKPFYGKTEDSENDFEVVVD